MSDKEELITKANALIYDCKKQLTEFAYTQADMDKAIEQRDQWHEVIKECEYIFGCTDTAESASMSNLPNLIRDLISKNRIIEQAKRETAEKLVERLEGLKCALTIEGAVKFNEAIDAAIREVQGE